MKTTINVASAFAFAFFWYGCDPAVAQCQPYVNGSGYHACNYGGWKGGAHFGITPWVAERLPREYFYGNRNTYRDRPVYRDYQYREGFYGSRQGLYSDF